MSTFDHLFSFKITNSFHNNINQHHLHPNSQAFFSKYPRCIKSIPLVQNKSKTSHTVPTRQEIVDWQATSNKHIVDYFKMIGLAIRQQFYTYLRFLSLSREDFVVCTTIDSSKFIQLFLKNYTKSKGDRLIHLPTSRVISNICDPFFPQNSVILECLLYAATIDPQIYFDSDKTTPSMILKWLQEISQMQVFELSTRSLNKEKPEQNLLWFNSNTFHPLSAWLANEIEKNILKSYFNKNNHNCSLRSLKNYIKESISAPHILKLLQMTLEEVQNGFISQYQSEISELRRFQDSFAHQLQAQLMSSHEDESKKTKKRRKKQKRSQSEQANHKDSNSIQMQELQNQQILEISQKSMKMVKQISLNERTESYQADEQKINQQTISSFKSVSKSSDETCQCDEFSQEELQKQSMPAFKEQNSNDLEEKDEPQSPINFSQIQQKKKRRKRKNGKNSNKIFEEFKNKVTHNVLNKQLDNLLDTLSIESNQKLQSKALAFQRVRYFIKSIYPYSEGILFGSNAVGLSLPTSDIDIMLVGLPFSSREQLCEYLSQIEIYINSMAWVTSCTIYPHAKVPILKLQIDTSIKYLAPKVMANYHQMQNSCMSCLLDLKNSAKGSVVKVDITISNDINMTSPTTQLMRNWLTDKPSMQRVLLALKYILTSRGYSQNFKGGIGSFCLFIMVSAYFQHFDEKREQSDCEILLDILKFYGEQFENHMNIVSLSMDKDFCFIDNQKALKMYDITEQLVFNSSLRVINPLNSKLLSMNCSQYPLIKAQWKKIRQEIMQIDEIIEMEISNTINISEMTRLIQNQKSFDKWVNRFQSKIPLNVGKILTGNF